MACESSGVRFTFSGRYRGCAVRRVGLVVLILLGLSAISGAANADAGGLSSSDIAIYKQAFSAVSKDRWADARAIAAKAKNKLPAKVIQWLDLTRPGPGRDFDEMTTFMVKNPSWPRLLALQAQAERAMPDGMPAKSVIAWFNGREPQTPEGATRLIAALTATGAAEPAAKVARAAWLDLDFDSDDEDAFLDAAGPTLRPADHEAR